MAEQQNYQSNLQELSDSYTRYNVSRIIANKKDDLLDMEVPADFSVALLENNIEVNLYSLADNSLIFSDVVKNVSGSIFIETLQYSDNSLRRLLYIDFAKVQGLDLPSGQYSVTLNFFADEIGSYDDRLLKVNRISTSRTEIELKLMDLSKQQLMTEFVLPSINSVWITDALKQAFNQSGSTTIPADNTLLTSQSIGTELPAGMEAQINQYNFESVYDISQEILNKAYIVAKEEVTKLLNENKTRFTTQTLSSIISSSLATEYETYINQNKVTVSQLPYDLVVGD
jgi:hypothetical protein